MATQTTEKQTPMTEEQRTQIKRQLEDNAKYAFDEFCKSNPSIDSAQRLIERGKELKESYTLLVKEYGTTPDIRVVADWQKFYKEHFNLDVDFSRVAIPPRPKGNWRMLFIAQGMTMNTAFNRCKKLFKTWQYAEDLDTAIPTNIRTASQNYVVWVLDDIEPDKEHRGKSTRQADPDMKIGITVLERIIFELKYFSETGKHLDIKGVTFCSGSRYSDGDVPSAHWYDDDVFGLVWYDLGYSNSAYGIREAVSL